MATTGAHWTFSPVLCLSRDVRWGRTGETFGEDPFLIGEFGAAMIKGYQGSGLNDGLLVPIEADAVVAVGIKDDSVFMIKSARICGATNKLCVRASELSL